MVDTIEEAWDYLFKVVHAYHEEMGAYLLVKEEFLRLQKENEELKDKLILVKRTIDRIQEIENVYKEGFNPSLNQPKENPSKNGQK